MQDGSNFNTDRSFFTVIMDHKDGAYVPQTDLSDLTEEKVIQGVDDGDFDDVILILESNPSEGWSRDVTEDILARTNRYQSQVRFSDKYDPNRGERIGCFEAGVGRFGPFNGRAA